MVDLRSDTLTRPSEGMRRAMAGAEVGDDVFGEDPTVRRLEAMAADRLGFEAALFVPTGTMGNQVAVHLHTSPGDDVLLDRSSHIYNYELGAMAAWSGTVPRVLEGESGAPSPPQLEQAIAPEIYYMARPTLLALENTANHAGGTVLDVNVTTALLELAERHHIRTHLDGARIFNAAAALACSPADLASRFDTAMFCLSKGLGAPVGSLLCGSADLMREARIVRKRMGGGMRQSGILAAAGIYALEHHVGRLGEDHERARKLAVAMADHPAFSIDLEKVVTNIVVAEVVEPFDAGSILSALAERQVLGIGMGSGRIRLVTHLDVGEDDIRHAVESIAALPDGPGMS
ncbi:MAG: low specificity L-threonine aldolase [Acidobacteria bacterium]|uniref:Low specificity L-threonine aldolase n=1 Tax=Candidatus Polarisedimenticola svalbardensis TaxID=2886004 RepID=A0A8J6XTV3_9BACT|nr:low specificity L-threonine aldolase [Candidatus Polarisedimenticola svalbardensis]